MNLNLPIYKLTSRLDKTEAIHIFTLVAIWIFMILLVNPSGNFPLMDDWDYGRAVQSIVEKGKFYFSSWPAMNLVAQIFWGALFCLPFGFSFNALRFSTLILGLTGVLGTYGLLREINLHSTIALLGALVVAVNPVYFGLSNTFMSDVPFFAFAILSLLFLIRGLQKESVNEIVIGTITACIALLIRQLAIAIVLAFGCAYIFKKGINVKNIIKGFSPAIICILVQVSYQRWLIPLLPAHNNYGYQIKHISSVLSEKGIEEVVHKFTSQGMISLVYLGWFLFPLLLVLFSLKLKEFSLKRKVITIIFTSAISTIILGKIILKDRWLPSPGGVLHKFGFGLLYLRDATFKTFNLDVVSTPTALKIFWFFVTVIGGIGTGVLILYLLFSLWQLFLDKTIFTDRKWLIVFIMAAASIYFFPLGIGVLAERYLLFLLPLLMILISLSLRNIINLRFSSTIFTMALSIILIYGIFTVGATHDYFLWNRTRWQALNYLMQEFQISPSFIDGGHEFNGWYLYDSNYKPKAGKSEWWVDKDDYIVSFTGLSSYEELKQYPLKRWLPFGPEKIVVLHKNTSN